MYGKQSIGTFLANARKNGALSTLFSAKASGKGGKKGKVSSREWNSRGEVVLACQRPKEKT